jgi:hypothetical protein
VQTESRLAESGIASHAAWSVPRGVSDRCQIRARLRAVGASSRIAAFELVRVSHGEDFQLLPGESGNIVWVVRDANVLRDCSGARS